jgi:hypothetical protein
MHGQFPPRNNDRRPRSPAAPSRLLTAAGSAVREPRRRSSVRSHRRQGDDGPRAGKKNKSNRATVLRACREVATSSRSPGQPEAWTSCWPVVVPPWAYQAAIVSDEAGTSGCRRAPIAPLVSRIQRSMGGSLSVRDQTATGSELQGLARHWSDSARSIDCSLRVQQLREVKPQSSSDDAEADCPLPRPQQRF